MSISCISVGNRGKHNVHGYTYIDQYLLYIFTHTYIHTVNMCVYQNQMSFYTFSCALETMQRHEYRVVSLSCIPWEYVQYPVYFWVKHHKTFSTSHLFTSALCQLGSSCAGSSCPQFYMMWHCFGFVSPDNWKWQKAVLVVQSGMLILSGTGRSQWQA